MSKIRITLVAVGVAVALAAVPAFATSTTGENDRYAVAEQITVAPGGHAGWEPRPGSAVVIVRQGTLSLYDGQDASYEPRRYTAGDTYLEDGTYDVVVGRNEGTTPLELIVIHVDVES